MIFCRLFHRSRRNETAQVLYDWVVSQARHPIFYTRFGVADTVDGRFDMIVLHAFLLLRRLSLEQKSTDLAQALFDVMFSDMDHNLREMGVSDLLVKGKIMDMVSAFYGRFAAYAEATAAQDNLLLVEALRRNVYRVMAPSPDNLNSMVAYVREMASWLTEQSIVGILKNIHCSDCPP